MMINGSRARLAVAMAAMSAVWVSTAGVGRAATYYVAPTGSDSAAGAIGTPFATITKAISKAVAGDTILMRGGTYTNSSTISISSSKNGTAALPYTIANYASEVPVLDFTPQAFSSSARGIQLDGSYWNIRGLTVANAKDNGISISGSNNVMDRLVLRGNQDTGLQIAGSGTRTPANNLIVNCDSYANYDPVTHGENADGFGAKFRGLGNGNVFKYDRAWGNADDGWDFYGADKASTMIGCMAYNNGFNNFGDTNFQGDGNGFKLGHDSGPHVLQNNVAFGNRLNGFDVNGNSLNDYGPGIVPHGVTLDNNTAYDNGNGSARTGFNFNFDDDYPHVLKNNLAYLGASGNANIYPANISDHNSYNAGYTATASDFLSLDDAIAIGPRQPDGSLPYSNFLRLAPGSDMIDTGTDVGLAYSGAAPDVGAYETPEPAAISLLLAGGVMLRRRRA